MTSNNNEKQENSAIDVPASKQRKPVSTVIGKAFDAIERQLLEGLESKLKEKKEAEGSSDEPVKIDKKGTLMGKGITMLKQTIMAKKNNDEVEQKRNEVLAQIKAQKELVKELPKELPKEEASLNKNPNSKIISSKIVYNNKTEKKEPVEKKEETKLPSIKNTEKVKVVKENSVSKPVKKQTYKFETEEEELFTETGLVEEYDEEVELAKEKVKDLTKNFSYYLKVIYKATELFITRFIASLLRLAIIVLKPVSKIFERFIKKKNKVEAKDNNVSEVIEKTEKESVNPIDTFQKASFDDMSELNITFTDNYDVPFYKKTTLKLTKAEEDLMLMNALEAIKQCSDFTKDSPPIKDGFYKNQNISEMMENVTDIHIFLFLGYVKSKPKKYIGKNWKISETFATWLLNNAPMAKK